MLPDNDVFMVFRASCVVRQNGIHVLAFNNLSVLSHKGVPGSSGKGLPVLF